MTARQLLLGKTKRCNVLSNKDNQLNEVHYFTKKYSSRATRVEQRSIGFVDLAKT